MAVDEGDDDDDNDDDDDDTAAGNKSGTLAHRGRGGEPRGRGGSPSKKAKKNRGT